MRLALVALVLTCACAWGAREPRFVWRYQVQDTSYASPVVADLEGDGQQEVLCAFRDRGEVVCLSQEGAPKWRYQGGGTVRNAPCVSEVAPTPGLEVVIVEDQGVVHCVSARGRLLWRRELPGPVGWAGCSAADLGGDGACEVVVGCENGDVVRLSGEGDIEWLVRLPGAVNAALAVGDVNGDGRLEVLAAEDGGAVHCLDADGRPLWEFVTGATNACGPVLADVDGDGGLEALLGSDNERFYCVRGDGRLRWSVEVEGTVETTVAVADVNGDGQKEILLSAGSGRVYCLSPSGSVVWEQRLEGRVDSAPVVVDVDGDGRAESAWGTKDNYLYLLSCEGRVLFRWDAGTDMLGSCAVLAAAPGEPARVVAPLYGGTVLAWEPWEGPSGAAAWPMRRFDAAQTGCVPAGAGPRVEMVSWGQMVQGMNTGVALVSGLGAGEHEVEILATASGGAPVRTVQSVAPDAEGRAVVAFPIMVGASGEYRVVVRVGNGLPHSVCKRIEAYQGELRRLGEGIASLSAVEGRLPALDGRRADVAGMRRTLEALRSVEARARAEAFDSVCRGLREQVDYWLARAGQLSLTPLGRRGRAERTPLALPKLAGRDFWHVVTYMPDKWREYGLAEKPFIWDAAKRLHAYGNDWARDFGRDSAAWGELAKDTRPVMVLSPFVSDLAGQIPRADFERLVDICGERFVGFAAHEWGYGATRNWEGEEAPKSRHEATLRLEESFKGIMENGYGRVYAGDGYCNFHHLAYKLGASACYAEVGENIPCTPVQFAFARGAARQFGKPWATYLSAWFRGSVTTYNEEQADTLRVGDRVWSGAVAGHSVSLTKRLLFGGWLAGAMFVHHESDAFAESVFIEKHAAEGGVRLSPIGQVADDWFEFTRRHAERGSPWAPVAFLIDYEHGWWFATDKTWGLFPRTRAEKSLDRILAAIYPWGGSLDDEEGYMVNGPLGDVFDVVVTEAPTEVFDAYPVIWLLGGPKVDEGLAVRLDQYVRGGGTVVMNVSDPLARGWLAEAGGAVTSETRYAETAVCSEEGSATSGTAFPYAVTVAGAAKVLLATPGGEALVVAFERGQGKVVVALVPDMLDCAEEPVCFLMHLAQHARSCAGTPEVIGEVEYMLLRRPDGWLVGLVNNRGVWKRPATAEEGDPLEQRQVVVRWAGAGAAQLWTAHGETPLAVQGKEIAMKVPPGEVRVVMLGGGG